MVFGANKIIHFQVSGAIFFEFFSIFLEQVNEFLKNLEQIVGSIFMIPLPI